MATYPAALPTLATVTSNTVPSAADVNVPNAEIAAAATEFGVNPQIIDDTVSPGASPASVAAVLDMFANIVKTNGGVSGWQKSAVPAKQVIYGHGTGSTVPSGAIYFLNTFGYGLNATESFARGIMTYPGSFRIQDFWIQFLTSQPADWGAQIQLYKNGTYNTDFMFMPVSYPAGVYHFPVAFDVTALSYALNDTFSIAIYNQISAAASAQIGAWSLTMTQIG